MKIIAYDTEIQRAIKSKEQQLDPELCIPDIEYCEGWQDFPNMGISVACVGSSDFSESYFGKNLLAFQPADIGDLHLIQSVFDSAERIVDFNGLQFDCKLLAANGIIVPTHKHYDICAEFKKAKRRAQTRGVSFDPLGSGSLDALCRANLGRGKSGEGAAAPINWQRGERLQVIYYCQHDVRLTLDLYLKLEEKGGLLSSCGQFVPMSLKPQEVLF